MTKCLCDICQKNEASEHLKVKKLIPTLTSAENTASGNALTYVGSVTVN